MEGALYLGRSGWRGRKRLWTIPFRMDSRSYICHHAVNYCPVPAYSNRPGIIGENKQRESTYGGRKNCSSSTYIPLAISVNRKYFPIRSSVDSFSSSQFTRFAIRNPLGGGPDGVAYGLRPCKLAARALLATSWLVAPRSGRAYSAMALGGMTLAGESQLTGLPIDRIAGVKEWGVAR